MAVTPNFGWPTPDDDDLVSDGAQAIRAFGDAVDAGVFANGTAIGALEALNPLAFGTAVASVGDALVYDGAEWQPHVPSENVIINGAMQVHQRGTSATGITGTGYFTADRWQLSVSNMGTWTQTLETDAPTGSGFQKSWKVLCTTADSAPAAADFIFVTQRIEGQNVQEFLKGTSSAKPFTLSFWVKTNVTGTYIAEMFDATNSRQVSATYSVASANTWEKKTITFPADTAGAFANSNASALLCDFFLGVGSDRSSGTLNTTWADRVDANRCVGQVNVAAATNNYWQVTGVQLEAGPIATPFQFEDFGTTLAKCQRYCFVIKPPPTSFRKLTTAYVATTDFVQTGGPISFPVTMRTAPSLTVTFASNNVSAYDGTEVNVTGFADGSPWTTVDDASFNATTGSGLTVGRTAHILHRGSDIVFSAEL